MRVQILEKIYHSSENPTLLTSIRRTRELFWIKEGLSIYRSKYKYILAGIDSASRFKVARPLRTIQERDVAEMIADIYKVGPLRYPKIFQCDNGSEFKGEVTKTLEKQEVKIQRVTTKYKHTNTAFVEALNKILAERLFKVRDAQELNDPEKVSSRWVKHLYGLVDELNDTETELIGINLRMQLN